MSESVSILLVEDDLDLRELLGMRLKKNNFQVLEAENGEHALQLLNLHSFNIVLSDIRMPKVDGIELLMIVKEKFKIPVILMTGFSEILEIKSAHDIGAHGFLAKPFKNEEMLCEISKCLNSNSKITKSKVNEFDKSDFCKMGIDNFISGKIFPYPIYLELSQSKIVKIAQKGEDLTKERIGSLKSKGVLFLYLLKSDFSKHVGFSVIMSRKIKENKKIPIEVKQKFMSQTSELIVEKLFLDTLDKASFLQAKDFT